MMGGDQSGGGMMGGQQVRCTTCWPAPVWVWLHVAATPIQYAMPHKEAPTSIMPCLAKNAMPHKEAQTSIMPCLAKKQEVCAVYDDVNWFGFTPCLWQNGPMLPTRSIPL